MSRLTVVIPTVQQLLPRDNVTLRTLEQQTWRDFTTIVVWDSEKKGASWARNAGFRDVATELVMFCDDDIEWNKDAFALMIACLDLNLSASYVYCGYVMRTHNGNKTVGNRAFCPATLKGYNFVSTMSIIRTRDFPGFDESIQRFQDWDLWLTMLRAGKVGVWCGQCLFTTQEKPGITFGNPITPAIGDGIIKRKHSWIKGGV